MTDKTRSPGAWAHDRRQDDWAITPKIQQATSAPDAGHGASRIVAIGRHPKPSTTPDIIRSPNSNISIDQA
jgi:hypothetical protein